jgi:hypothetical protein
MHTARQRCEPVVDDKGPYWLNEPRARRAELDAAWRCYCAVIRDLDMTTAELEALQHCGE